jgi:hypothetical protein
MVDEGITRVVLHLIAHVEIIGSTGVIAIDKPPAREPEP